MERIMKCKKCNAEVNVLDSFCSSCGVSQSLLDDGPAPIKSENPFLDRGTDELDKELQRAKNELFNGLSGEMALTSQSPPGQQKSFQTFGALAAPTKSFFFDLGGVDLKTSEQEIHQIAGFVFQSPHIQSNQLYRIRAASTTIVYLGEDLRVNAFATDHPYPGLYVQPPLIAILGGMISATRLTALALGNDRIAATDQSRQLFVQTVRAIGKKIVEENGNFSSIDASEIFNGSDLAEKCEDGEVQRCARSYGAAMNMSVIAHELGHIVLGHTLAESQVNMETSRNQEREADSFAASVASASPFSDYTVAGGIFWWVILTWVEEIAGGGRATTHPHSRERLLDYIRANEEQARALGIDDGNVVVFLP
jgi:IrrE N-terminal-like domain